MIYGNKAADVYIGSTTKELAVRLCEHQSRYRKCELIRQCMSHTLFTKYGIDGCSIELLEEVSFDDINDLRKKEQYFITEYGNRCVNKQHAFMTEEDRKEYKRQYRKDRKDLMKEYLHTYYQNNKDRWSKCNEKITCECGVSASKRNMAAHRKSQKHQAYLQTQ